MTVVQTGRGRVLGEARGWLLAAAGVGCFFGGVWVASTHRGAAAHAATRPAQAVVATTTTAPGPTELTLVYSTEATAWLSAAVADFERATPGVRVRLQGMGSLEAERAIASGRLRPTLWMPADSMVADLLDADWRASHAGAGVVVREGQWPTPMVLSPMVFVVWASRARVLVPEGTTLTWARLATVARSGRGWAGVGGEAQWGGLKFGHTDPTRSHAGLDALVLMAYGWKGRAGALTPADVRGAGFEGFMRALEASDPAGDRGTTHSGEFAQTIALQGPGRYDVAMVYESQAIATLGLARARWGEGLRVYYPTVNVWSDHPLCLMDDPAMTEAQRSAAAGLATYLRGAEVQRAAVRQGFRPADVNVAVADEDPENPFVKYRGEGVRVALPQVADAPSSATVEALTATWRRVTGR